MPEQEEGQVGQNEGGEGEGEGSSNDNLKAEFNRKIGNIEQKMQESNNQLLTQISQMVSQPQQRAVEQETAEEPDPIADPKGFARYVEERAEARVMAKVNVSQAAEAEKASVLGRMINEYPELKDASNTLTKRAREILGTFGAGDQNSPLAYEVAISRAAQELEVTPVSRRQAQSEGDGSFSMSGSGGGSSRQRRSENQGSDKLDQRVEDFASLMGLDVNNKEVRKRLIEKANIPERDWYKYQERR